MLSHVRAIHEGVKVGGNPVLIQSAEDIERRQDTLEGSLRALQGDIEGLKLQVVDKDLKEVQDGFDKVFEPVSEPQKASSGGTWGLALLVVLAVWGLSRTSQGEAETSQGVYEGIRIGSKRA